jgi:SAM-dependent methyltransferase
MNMGYQAAVELEIKRLEGLGWRDFSVNDSGLRIAKNLLESEVSFPSESYSPEKGNSESSGIWASHRAKKISQIMNSLGKNIMWEIGSGDGNVAISLRDRNQVVIGIEPLCSGAAVTSMAGIRTYLGTLDSLELPSESIEVIGAFDVLEHIERPEELLKEIYRVLKPDGIFLMTVPAHQWLYSDFDKSIGHFRRYSRRALRDSLMQSGFEQNQLNFMFSLFVVPAFLLRRLPSLLGRNRNSQSTIQSVKRQNQLLSLLRPFLSVLLAIERILNLPIGLSLIGVSKK